MRKWDINDEAKYNQSVKFTANSYENNAFHIIAHFSDKIFPGGVVYPNNVSQPQMDEEIKQ